MQEVVRTNPTLIVTVDTEEEGLWGGAWRSHDNPVRNVRGLPAFQGLCDRLGVRPTYLVDTPVADDIGSVKILKELQSTGCCEIGAHLHPWCAPPFREELTRHNSYMCNLPARLQREKLVRLTELLEYRFDKRPTSFRAGRYGLDIVGARILKELGYLVDSSVVSFMDYSDENGPDFRSFPYKPYRIGNRHLRIAESRGTMMELPVSVGFGRGGFRWRHRIREFARSRALRCFHLVGILDRLNLVRRINFNPEKSDAVRMKQLVDAYVAHGAPCMVMSLHSSSLLPGFSPYVPEKTALDALYANLEDTIDYCSRQYSMVSETLTECAERLMGRVSEQTLRGSGQSTQPIRECR